MARRIDVPAVSFHFNDPSHEFLAVVDSDDGLTEKFSCYGKSWLEKERSRKL